MDVSKILDCNSVEEQDLVSQYVGRKLSPEEAEAFEEHYFGCDRCWAEVQRATELRAALAEKKATDAAASPVQARVIPGPWRNGALLAIAAAIAVGILAGLLILRGGGKSPVQAEGKSPVQEVVAAAGVGRTTEARLTGGLPHADRAIVSRGTADSRKSWRLLKALEDAQREAERQPSPDALRAVGLAELLLGEVDQAVTALKIASEKYPKDARILSDLAAAHFTLYERDRDVKELEAGSSAASRAVELDPKLKEAHFNKALILERLGFRGPAAEEWNLYLRLERDKDWTAEAERHYRELSGRPLSESWPNDKRNLPLAASRHDVGAVSRIVSRFPERSRQYVEDEVLPQWAAHSETSPTSLTVAREVGEAFRTSHDDSFLADSVARIDEALREASPPSDLAELREGHRLYGLGRQRYKNEAIGDALRAYQASEKFFEAVGSPFRDLAITEKATCQFYENDALAALRSVAPVVARSRGRYPQLFASAQWLTGLTEISLGHPSESLRGYSAALAAFQRVKDPENVAGVYSMIGEVYQELGEFGLASQYRRDALTTLSQTGEPRRLYVAFHLAGIAAQQARLPELARLAYACAVDSARSARNPDLVTHALIASAKAEEAFGNREAAAAHLQEADTVCRTIQDPSLRDRASAELSVVLGKFEARTNPARSFRELASATNFFEKKGDLIRVAGIRFERGRLYLALQNRRLAIQDFLAAVALLESLRSTISSESTRVSFFENAQDLFDETAGALANDGQVARAADVVERARARALLDMIETSLPGHSTANLYQAPLPQYALRRRLPPGTTFVEYALLENRLLVFTISPASVRLTTTSASSGKLQALTGAFLDSLERPESAGSSSGDAAAALYGLLIAPIRGELEGSRRLVFVPDKSLHRLPFAALRNPITGHYLIEDFQVGIAPSVTIYVQSIDRYRKLLGDQSERVLLVANPQFDRRLLPELGPLPEADREARDVSAYYRNSVTLSGRDATRKNLMARAPDASLIHFASHALIEPNAILSKLVLAPDPSVSDSGLLYAHEIPALRFPRTRLVVLSACETLRGPARGGEGVISLARAFLATGVPSVLGTLAPVADRPAAALLTAFHRRLSEGEDPITALRHAQLSLLGGSDSELRSPSGWAFFEIIGGTASS
jgi:CHAT domain-containing protein